MSATVGIVGCGWIAREHARAYQENGATIAAVYDVHTEAASKFAAELGSEVVVPSSLEEIASMQLTGVSICTPPGTHLDVCTHFLQSGTPVLCEKPLEASADAADRLASLAQEMDAFFMTGFCHRWHPPIVRLKEQIDAGAIGTPILFRNIFSGRFELKADHRSRKELSGGGAMIDTSSHSVDLFRFLLGEPDAVQATTASVAQEVAVEDFGAMTISRKNQVFGEIVACCSMGVGMAQLEVHGTEGLAFVEFFGNPPLKIMRKGAFDWDPIDCEGLPDRFTGETAHFLDCIAKGIKPSVTEQDGRYVSRILTAAYTSAASGERVTLQ